MMTTMMTMNIFNNKKRNELFNNKKTQFYYPVLFRSLIKQNAIKQKGE